MREDNYHINITNLKTGESQGFILSGGDMPFTMQGLDSVSTRIIEGEALYSDFTNSKVFSQSSWDKGLSKYWEPETISYNIYPTKKYRNAKNIKIKPGEFGLGGESLLVKNFADPTTQVSCLVEGETTGVIYAGIKGICQIWRSSDYGETWSLYFDGTSDTRFSGYNEVSDIVVHTNVRGISGYVSGFDVGTGNISLYFIAWNNSTNKGKVIKKILDPLNTRYITGYKNCYCHYYTLGSGSQTDFSLFTYGNTIYNNGIMNYNSYSFTVDFNYLYNGAYYTRLTLTGNTPPFFIGSVIEVNYGGTWYEATVYVTKGEYNTNCEIICSQINTGYTGGTYNVRVKQNNYIMLPCDTFTISGTAGKYISWGSIGMSFTYNGYKYYITGHSAVNGSYTFNHKNLIGYTAGDPTYYNKPTFIEIYSPDGQIGNLISSPNLTVDSFDLFFPTNYIGSENTFDNIKKFSLVKSPVYEELLGIREDTNALQLIGGQYFGGAVATTYISNNLYAMTFDVNGKPILYSNEQIVELSENIFPVSSTREYLGSAGTSSIYYYRAYIGTKKGTGNDGNECLLCSVNCSSTWASKPTITEHLSIGEQSITDFVIYNQDLFFVTNYGLTVYRLQLVGSVGTLTKLVSLPIIDGTEYNTTQTIKHYNGKLVVGIQKGPGVYSIDPNVIDENTGYTEVLTNLTVDESINTKITALYNTGSNLLIGTNLQSGELFYYNPDLKADTGRLESSIYGGYIPNIEKLFVYGYVRLDKILEDEGQKVAVEISLDGGKTWLLCPNKKELPFIETGVNWTDGDYFGDYNSLIDGILYTFFVPYNTLFNTIEYKIHLNRGTANEIWCNHVALHFNLNVKQEMYFNYIFTLEQREQLLDGITIDVDENNRKLDFLRELWTNQNMCLIKNVDGQEYTCIPYNDERTLGQGLIIQVSNSNMKNKDRDMLKYLVNMTFKSIANY